MTSYPALRPLRPTPRTVPHTLMRTLYRLALVLTLLACLCSSRTARARSGGIASEGCTGCHSGGKDPTVTITSDLTTVNPGSVVNLTISISPTNGTGAGFYIEASTGKFSIVDSGTHLVGTGVAQSATRTAASGNITFKVGWTAPTTPGGVDFVAWGNSVNGDRGTGGDSGGMGTYSFAFGCSGMKYYRDFDGDGVGVASSGTSVGCTQPQYYSPKDGDCDDNDPKIFPGSPEICDGKDNNCNGQIDEGLAIASYCTDSDGDGHGVLGKAMMMGCGPSKGFGTCDNDCNDNDPNVHPGAVEVCNNKDDNCDDRVDENARVVCGLGWCSRYGAGCTSDCTPGAPRAEECNDFDDDCDGVKDNGTDLELCGKPGLACKAGVCVAAGGGAAGGTSAGGGSNASSGAAGSTRPNNGAGATNNPPPSAGSSGAAMSDETSAGCNLGRSSNSSPFAASLLLLVMLGFRRKIKSTNLARN